MASEQFSLCWDNFHKNMSSGMNTLLENEDLVDVTLAVEGKYLKAHKMVLSVCSPYFKDLFKMNPCKHPIVFMKDVSYVAMSDLLQFMYQGEVQVSQENLTTFIKTAEALQIKGLTGDGNGATDCDIENQEESRPAPIEEIKFPPMRQRKVQQHPAVLPPPKRQRISAPSESLASSSLLSSTITKTEASTSSATTPTNEQIIQFKMEPFDQSQSVTVPDDNADETFADDPLDDTNADDTNDDYSMMEGGVEEPQAGTSTDGMAGEGQGELKHVKVAEGEPEHMKGADNHSKYFENSCDGSVIVDGFTYHHNTIKKTSNMRYLVCGQYKRLGCKARARIPLGGTIKDIVLNKGHNHPPFQEAGIRKNFCTTLKENIMNDPSTTLREVYDWASVLYLGCAEHKRSGCRGRATIPVGGSIDQLRMTQPHNHPPDVTAEEKDAFIKELKKAVRAHCMEKVTLKKVYETVAELFPKAAEEISFRNISSSLHRWRRNPLY